MSELPPVLTVAETARVLRCGRNRVYQLVHSGELRALRLGSRSLRITRADLARFLGSNGDSQHVTAARDGDEPTVRP